jgi:hypothetical protein
MPALYAEDGTGSGPDGVVTPFRKKKKGSIRTFVDYRKIAPESDTRDSYCDPSRATDPRNPYGTHADKKAASAPPLGCNLPDR